MIKAIGECVEQFAGEAVAKKVMEGSERITGETGKTEIAELVKGAMKEWMRFLTRIRELR